MVPVREVMTANPVVAKATATVQEAFDLLACLDVRHIPVVDDEGGLVGIVSERDLLSAASVYTATGGSVGVSTPVASSRDEPISLVMSTALVKVEEDAMLEDVIDRMLDHKVGAIPVVERETNRLVGIVSYVDVLRRYRIDLERPTRSNGMRDR